MQKHFFFSTIRTLGLDPDPEENIYRIRQNVEDTKEPRFAKLLGFLIHIFYTDTVRNPTHDFSCIWILALESKISENLNKNFTQTEKSVQ